MKSRSRSIEGVRITVFAKPRAKASRIVEAHGLTAKIAIAAPPVDGAANAELVAVLAKALSVPKSALHVALGGASKQKMVVATGVSEAEVIERLTCAISPGKSR